MKRKPPQDIVHRLLSHRNRFGWTQEKMGKLLGYTQGHYSKVETKEFPVSRRFRARADEFFALQREATSVTPGALETEIANAMRASKNFRSLVLAALQMHKDA